MMPLRKGFSIELHLYFENSSLHDSAIAKSRIRCCLIRCFCSLVNVGTCCVLVGMLAAGGLGLGWLALGFSPRGVVGGEG